MAESNITPIGHELVAKNAAGFIASMRQANQASEKFLDTIARGAKRPLDLVSGATLKRVDDFRDRIANLTQKALAYRGGIVGAAAQTDGFKNMLVSLNPTMALVAGGLALLTAGAIKLGKSFMELGARGAAAEGVIFAFSRIAAVADTTSEALLGSMRKAAAGTVSDLDLMKRANLALAGATGEVAKQMAQNLPKLLEIARAQARATGQDVGYLFESLVTGVKRASPMLIDNTGIVLKLGSANEKLAAKLGKSVNELTDAEKQVAILNATLEAGEKAVTLYGTKHKTAAELISSFKVRVQNMMDRLAVAIQPVYELILDVGDALLASIIHPIQEYVIPIIYELAKAFFGPLKDGWKSVKEGIQNTVAPMLAKLKEWLIPTIATIRLLGVAWKWVLEQTGRLLKPILQLIKAFAERIFGKDLNAQKFFEGGARAIGALAAGILKAANKYVFPAVIFIAKFIADLLVGMSPPPVGPLSKIDQGGANTMLAWLQGFTGVSLDPVTKVAQEVNAAMGSIAGWSLKQVETRLAQLDDLIRPFQERLSIIENRMNAILNPLKQIEGILDKRLDTALGDFFAGKLDAESVRALDRQKAALQERIAGVERASDEAAYQLSLKQLELVNERTLLEIQRDRLKALEQINGEAGDAATTIPDALDLSNLPVPDDPVGQFLGLDEDAIKKSMAGIVDALTEGWEGAGGPEALAEAYGNISQLKTQLGRIASADIFKGLKDTFNTVFGTGPDSLLGKVVSFGFNLGAEIVKIGDKINPMAITAKLIKHFFDTFDVTGTLADLMVRFHGVVGNNFSVGGLIGRILNAFDMTGFVRIWETTLDNPAQGVRELLTRFLPRIANFVAPGSGEIMSRLLRLDLGPFQGIWNDIFDSGGNLPNLFGRFTQRVLNFATPGMGDIARALSGFNLESFLNIWRSVLTTPGFGIPGLISAFISNLTNTFSSWGPLSRVFSGIASTLQTWLVQPIRNALNGVISAFEGAINSVVDAVNNVTQSSAFRTFGSITSFFGWGGVPRLGRVYIPRLREGALSAQGLMQLHRDELVMARQPVTVFPQQLSRQIMAALSGPRASERMVAGPTVNNSTSSQVSNTVTNNFRVYGQQSLRLAMAQAKGWA